MGEARTRYAEDSRHLANLTVPIALTQLATIALSTTDIVLLGVLGVDQLAAGGLAFVLFNQVRTMCLGLITAAGNHVAAAIGRAEHHEVDGTDEVRTIVRATFLVATAAGVVGATLLVLVGLALPRLGQDPTVAGYARTMLFVLAPGLLPYMWFQALRQYTVGMRRPQALLMITLASVALNLVLDLTFIYGWMGTPAMGHTGVALATTLVFFLSFVAFFVMVRRDLELAECLSMRIWRARREDATAILRAGVPISLTYGSEAGLLSVITLIMGVLGPQVLAAHNAVYQVTYVVFQIAVGLSHGSSILVSRAVARNEIDHARRLAWIVLSHAGLVVGAIGIIYAVVPGAVIQPFLGNVDAATEDIARSLLLVAIVLQFFDAAQNIGVGLLRGVDETAAAFRLSLVGYWAVGLPASVALAATNEPSGVWWGLTLGMAATAGLMLTRYFATLQRLVPVTAQR